MINEGQVLIRCLIENAFFVAALQRSHDDVVRYLQDSNKFSRYKFAKMLITRGDISPNHSEFQKVMEISKTKVAPPQSIKSIAKLGTLEKKYLNYSLLSSESIHFSASSISKHMNTGIDRKAWLGYKTGPGEDSEISEILKAGISSALDISIVGTDVFGDPSSKNKIRILTHSLDADIK
jgi:hypothetical protein